METLRRLYVGGISPLVTKAELEDRFGKFGRIDDVDIVCRKDVQGNPIKTFAYLNINISDVDLKKCISLLNKTKWKGGILEIEKAKESFLHRLSKERQEAKEEEGANIAPCLQNDMVLSLEKAGVTDFLMKSAVPGTEVPNHKNWVVSKFGRVLPVLHLSGKNQSKTMKYDPSKYCQNIKKIEDTFKLVPVSQLTSQLEGGDDEISRKRRGDFPNLMPPRKKKAVIPPISGGYNDTETDQRNPPLAPIQTAERQSNTKEKPLHLQNGSINRMTDEYDTDEELQYVLKREAATRGTVKYAEDCSIEVVDDSSGYMMAHWTKQKATPKTDSTCNGQDASDNDSVNTDEIISVAKTLQKKCNPLKTKAETVKQVKIQKCKEGSTFSHGTKDECKSADIEMSKSESDSETGDSENDGSSSYSDEEYTAMMQNCIKLDLTIGDLKTLAKEAIEYENEDKTENNSEYDNDDINSKHSDDVAENPLTSGSEIPTLEKKQNAKRSSAGIKKKKNTENMQRVLESGSQGNGDESDSSSSDFEEHYEPININGHRENVKTEALKPKSPVASQCLVNHELKKSAQGKKGDGNKNGNLGIENVKAKRGIEPDDIVASILECDVTNWQSNKKKNDTPVKPPAFKGLSSVLASATTANSVFGSSAISSVEDAAVTETSNDRKQSGCGSKQTKQAERPEPFRDSKLVSLEAKSKIKSGSSDISEKCNSGLSSTSSSFAKPSISRIDTAKDKTTLEVKQKQDNQKRLEAMGERRKELELQKQIIKGALLKLDSTCSKKSQHVVFDSDSASDEEASTSEKKSIFAHKKADPSTSKLFNSSEEDSDGDEKEDNQRFDIKAQYEGRSGMKLMQLQSCFGTDDRFKMDSRFLESNSEDEEALEAHNSTVDAQDDLSAEKKKNLGILQSILNINVEPQPARKQNAKGKQFKDLNSLHFDPEKKDHATFETKAGERERKSERKKKKLEAEKLPDVSKETFHEINMDFREVFGASKTQTTKGEQTTWDQEVEPEKETQKSSELLSLQSKNTEEPVEFTFSFFGNTTEESTSNSDPYKTKTIKAAKVAWQEDPRFQDSSSEDEEETSLVIENKTSTQPDKIAIRFFFVKDDERLKTGPTMFFRSSNTEQEVWEERKDFLLEECRKRHKDAKRKTKAKN
ncbi:nucleolar protein 8 isoform X2 [Rana temporaria]|uniref:nucleolar protein 8 isoform X2 n=1 Tax=Rana temporaria TaxID=8407 RepID=UPI001AAD81E1|nr:nucleolar protein 8 isoform X2 [Rana temporaria]